MKIKFISVLLMLSIGIWMTPSNVSAKGYVSYQVFYDELSPYGTWVGITNYGYVWRPNVDAGFTPYSTNGYWAYTDEGWTWISNYPWGWAPFHYGRWYDDPTYGPFWIPDNEWGPGWVTWRITDGYYGWAPMGPYYGNSYYMPYNRWCYVKGHDFGKKNNKDYYYVHSSYNGMFYHKTKALNNFKGDKMHDKKYSTGPDKSEVEKYTGKKITALAISENSKPGQKINKNNLQIYMPQVQKESATGFKPSPNKTATLKEVKTSSAKTTKASTQKVNQETKQQTTKSQQATSTKKTEGVKQQSQTTPSKKVEANKQQQTSPSKNVQSVKRQQTSTSNKSEGVKQSSKTTTSKKGK